MHPVLFEVFGHPVHPYGVLLALAFLAAISMAALTARREGLSPRVVLDLAIWIIVGAMVGARLYYVLLHLEEFRGDVMSVVLPLHDRSVWELGGTSVIGGLIGGTGAASLYLRLGRHPFPRYVDTLAPGIALGVVLARIGCFLTGCCYGKAWDGLWAVSFPAGSPAGRYQVEIHAAGLYPSQLYAAAGGLVILGILAAAGHAWRRWEGLRLYLVMVLYAVLRFIVDFTRYYAPGERIGPLSHSQVVCLVFLVFFGGLAAHSLKRGRSPVFA